MKLFRLSRLSFCRYCRAQTTFRKQSVSHKAHALGTIITFGLWAGIWLLVTLHWFIIEPWRCRVCRRRYSASQGAEDGPELAQPFRAPRPILSRFKAR